MKSPAPIPISCKALISCNWLKQSVAIFKSPKQARKSLTSFDADKAPGAAGYAQREDGQTIFWIMLQGKRPQLGVIIHEAIHCVDYLCEVVGIPVSVECSEVRTYMTEWLVGEICKAYKF